MTHRAKSMALNCAALVSLSVAGRAAEAQSNTFPTTLQVDEHRLQKVPAVFKFQARISQAKNPVGEAQFSKVIVNLVKGTQTLCVEEFTAVKVRDSVLNLELGRGMSCSLENVIAENNGLKFQVCLNGTENCLKPIELAAVPYAVKSSFAATSQAAHTADISGQAYYTHRATADRDMLLRGELGVGYFDFETPASASNLYTDFAPYANNGFISWAPVSTEHPRLTVCSRDVVTGAPQPLEELVLHAAQTSMKGAAAIDSDAQVGGKLQVDGASTLRGGLTVADAPGTDWDLDCQGSASVAGDVVFGSASALNKSALTIYSSTTFKGNVSIGGTLTATHSHPGTDVTTPVAAADAVPWSGVADKPSTFPPSSHNHLGFEIAGPVNHAINALSANLVPWDGVAGKPSTFPPSDHAHAALVPSGAVMFFNLTSCPAGWTELVGARGRVIKGLPLNGTIMGAVGTPLGNLQQDSHYHNSDHHHYIDAGTSSTLITGTTGGTCCGYAGTGYFVTDTNTDEVSGQSHGHKVEGWTQASETPNTTAASGVIPYLQLLACQKT